MRATAIRTRASPRLDDASRAGARCRRGCPRNPLCTWRRLSHCVPNARRGASGHRRRLDVVHERRSELGSPRLGRHLASRHVFRTPDLLRQARNWPFRSRLASDPPDLGGVDGRPPRGARRGGVRAPDDRRDERERADGDALRVHVSGACERVGPLGLLGALLSRNRLPDRDATTPGRRRRRPTPRRLGGQGLKWTG